MNKLLSLFIFAVVLISYHVTAQSNQKHRAIILSDIENEPDDTESFVRLLLYSRA